LNIGPVEAQQFFSTYITIGWATDSGYLQLNDLNDLSREELREAYVESFARIMSA